MIARFKKIRSQTETLCVALKPEDFLLQPVEFVSPVKWHLAHSTWFFENFILKPFYSGYTEFDPNFGFLFNSYYESEGPRTARNQRGNLSRPSVEEVFEYRTYVNSAVEKMSLAGSINPELSSLFELGLQHEQQHQELLITDLKYCFSLNPIDIPVLGLNEFQIENSAPSSIVIAEGIYEIGFGGNGFCFDNELNRHKVYINQFAMSNQLVSIGEWLDFMEDGGYENPLLWHAEGWDWVKLNSIKAPLYWEEKSGVICTFTLNGRKPIDPHAAVSHISFYEASAFADWAGKRLPTEAEWEVASTQFKWGNLWEWTNSAYLPYPGYKKSKGAIGEYNGKFMINQHVLRGSSLATPFGHSRNTYRNFFHPHLRWQFTGLRLAENA
jgi:ergothioneine biosynthesis protein EgtB